MRKTQLKLNIMRKYQMLVNKKQSTTTEGLILHYKLEGTSERNYLEETEINLDGMRENSWGHKNKYIYKLIRGKKGHGPLI
eukprot:2361926-Heterocapsa_arctica.AAC.1